MHFVQNKFLKEFLFCHNSQIKNISEVSPGISRIELSNDEKD